jgi:hypothetical protein
LGIKSKEGVDAARSALEQAADQFLVPDRSKVLPFAALLKNAVYEQLRGALIKAFVDAALANTALAPLMAVLTTIIGKIVDAAIKGLDEKVDRLINRLKKNLEGLKDVIDVILPVIDTVSRVFDDVLAPLLTQVTDSTNAVNDALDSNCEGQCQLEKRLYVQQLGLADLTTLGRAGSIQAQMYVPVEDQPGKPAQTPTGGGNGGGGGGDDQYPNSPRIHPLNQQVCKWFQTEDQATKAGFEGATQVGPNLWRGCHYEPTSDEQKKLASGGIVTSATNALIGEAGPEAVIPLGPGNSRIFTGAIAAGLLDELGLKGVDVTSIGQVFRATSGANNTPPPPAASSTDDGEVKQLLRAILEQMQKGSSINMDGVSVLNQLQQTEFRTSKGRKRVFK